MTYGKEDLIQELISQGVLKNLKVLEAFEKVDRINFVPKYLKEQAYFNHPLPIGEGQTISQPYTVAFMLELLDVKEGQKVLDVGFGSGWTTALLSSIVGNSGKVIGLEIVPEVFEFGKKNLKGYNNVKLFLQSGWEGLLKEAPFDRILVSAAATEIPLVLKDHLVIGGKLVIPIGEIGGWFSQSVKLIEKVSAKEFKEKDFSGFAFVPLVK